MSYHTGTISSATPAVDLMTALNTNIAAHAAWDYVETATVGTDVTDIFKCLASVSGLSKDWHLLIRRTSDTSVVSFYLGEDWDATNKRISKYAPVYTTNSYSVPA